MDERLSEAVCWALAIVLLPCVVMSPANVQAQEKHVVSSQELHKEAMRPAEARGANEAAFATVVLLGASTAGAKIRNIDYSKLDKAVGQLSEEDLAKLAARSREAQNNFSGGRAGSLSDRDLLIIIIIAVLVIALIAVLH